MISTKDFDAVESHYAARWQGIIIGRKKRHRYGDLCLVLLIYDRNGNRFTKRITKILDEAYLEPIAPIEVLIRKDWLICVDQNELNMYYEEMHEPEARPWWKFWLHWNW